MSPVDGRDLGTAVGLVDALGYLYCAPCAVAYGKAGEPVTGPPHTTERCDGCGRVVGS